MQFLPVLILLTQDAGHVRKTGQSNIVNETFHDFVRLTLTILDQHAKVVVLEYRTIPIDCDSCHLSGYKNRKKKS